jgi:hypothetical protein
VSVAEAFVRDLLPHGAPDGTRFALAQITRTGCASRYFRSAAGVPAAVTAGARDWYVGVALADAENLPPRTERVSNAAAVGLLGLVLDVDLAGSPDGRGGTRKGGAPSLADALALAHAITPPTLIVETGGGVQPWWLFPEPWLFADDAERREAAMLLRAWQAAHRALVPWHVDPTHDLAHLFRLPGTLNGKTPENLRPVACRNDRGARILPAAAFALVDAYRQAVEPAPVATNGTPVDVDPAILAAMLDVPEFRRVWDWTPDGPTAIHFPSTSERDYALASLVTDPRGANYDDAATIAVIRACRIHHGDPSEKTNRSDYLTRTVAKARAAHNTSSDRPAGGAMHAEQAAAAEPKSDQAHELRASNSRNGSTPTRGRRFTLAELRTIPRPGWLVEHIIPAGGLVPLYGPPGAGKSFLALDFALCVWTGTPWFGASVRQGRVVYIAAEGASGISARVDAWTAEREVDPPDDDGLVIVPDALDLLDSTLIDYNRRTIEPGDEAPSLVIVDTLARCLVGGDENSARDMGRLIANVDAIRREWGCAVLLVHHTGKDGDSERGSSALRGAADAMLSLKPSGGGVALASEKAKDSPPFATRYLSLAARPRCASAVLVNQTNRDALTVPELQIVEALEQSFGGDEASATRLLGVCGVGTSTYYSCLRSLQNRGMLTQRKEGTRTYYRLTLR